MLRSGKAPIWRINRSARFFSISSSTSSPARSHAAATSSLNSCRLSYQLSWNSSSAASFVVVRLNVY